MSKSLATIATQPLIVAKVGLQSRSPPSRQGKPFKSFVEVMQFIIENEGVLSLFKGMGPQLLKGVLVQGILMMTKERYVFTTRLGATVARTNRRIQCRIALRSLSPLYPALAVSATFQDSWTGSYSQGCNTSDDQMILCHGLPPKPRLAECEVKDGKVTGRHILLHVECTYRIEFFQ